MKEFEAFKLRVKEFQDHKLREIRVAFLFGLVLRSTHHINKYPEKTKDHVALSHSLFSVIDEREWLPIILETQDGKDLNGQTEIDFIESGFPEYEYLIKRAIKFSRPRFTFFFIQGLMLGDLNGSRISNIEYLQLFNLFPEEFILGFQNPLLEIHNFFNEKGFDIRINNGRILNTIS